MKRIIFVLVLFCFKILDVAAATGDVAGEYYSTDISTILNGEEIDSINIGGETLISAEDMYYYSFDVEWSEEKRTLCVDSVPQALNGRPPHIKKSNYPDGVVLGKYYETDIVTYLDGEPITAYNIGGRTYMHAEEMRNFGYEVIWDEVDRNLFIKSPDRAGYVYGIKLSQSKEQTKEGVGGFSLKYTPDGIIGTGDAEYCNIDFYSRPTKLEIVLGFYQGGGLFQSQELINTLYSLTTAHNSAPFMYLEEQIAEISNDVAQYINISVNGKTAKNISVSSFRGNGHHSFSLTIEDMPRLRKGEISEITLAVGKDKGSEEFAIVNHETDLDKIETVINEKLKKYDNDYMVTHYQTDEYFAVYMRESEWLGRIDAHRLYLVNRKTWECSGDILEQVREIDGFKYGILNPFDFKVGDVKNNLFFACVSPEKTGNFYVEMDSATVHKISEHTK